MTYGVVIFGTNTPAKQQLPNRSQTPELDSVAWIGDSWLTATLREACVDAIGRRDGKWVDDRRSNHVLTEYMRKEGYDVDGRSEGFVGQVFEYLYVIDEDFRAKYLATVIPESTAEKVTSGSTGEWTGGCWRKLFSVPIVSIHPWSNDDFLTKKQLTELSLTHPWSTNKFSVEKNGHTWHLVDGDTAPARIVWEMFNKTKLGGVKRCPPPFHVVNSTPISAQIRTSNFLLTFAIYVIVGFSLMYITRIGEIMNLSGDAESFLCFVLIIIFSFVFYRIITMLDFSQVVHP